MWWRRGTIGRWRTARDQHEGPDSDLDIYLVVTELTPALRRWIDEIAWEVGFDKDRVISTLVTTRRGLEQGPFGAQPVVQSIEREGIRV